MRDGNPPPREIVEVRVIWHAPGTYSVHGPDRAGIQLRPRHGIPPDVLKVLDRDSEAMALARLDRNGRWRLIRLATPDCFP